MSQIQYTSLWLTMFQIYLSAKLHPSVTPEQEEQTTWTHLQIYCTIHIWFEGREPLVAD